MDLGLFKANQFIKYYLFLRRFHRSPNLVLTFCSFIQTPELAVRMSLAVAQDPRCAFLSLGNVTARETVTMEKMRRAAVSQHLLKHKFCDKRTVCNSCRGNCLEYIAPGVV